MLASFQNKIWNAFYTAIFLHFDWCVSKGQLQVKTTLTYNFTNKFTVMQFRRPVYALPFWLISRVFLLRQLWFMNYYVKSWSNNLSEENINTGVSVVIKTERELKCQKYHQFFCFHYRDFLMNF